MPKRGKNYTEAAKLIDRNELYEVADAVDLVVKASKAKFDETVEVHIKLGVDGRHADQQVRGAIVLPNGTGKTNRVLVFAKGPKAQEAEAAGADYVGAEELAQKIQTENWFDFDVIVATPDMIGVVGKLGKVFLFFLFCSTLCKASSTRSLIRILRIPLSVFGVSMR